MRLGIVPKEREHLRELFPSARLSFLCAGKLLLDVNLDLQKPRPDAIASERFRLS